MNLIFDFSGTLAEDSDLAWRLTDATLREFGDAGVDEATYRREFALPAEGFYRRRLPQVAFADIETVFAAWTRRLYPEAFRWAAGVAEGLPCLARKHDLHVFSTLDAEALESALIRSGLRGHFRAVIGNAGDKRESLVRYVRERGLHPDDTAYIGDTGHDLEAAKAAGVAGWAVTWGHGRREDLVAQADLTFHSFADLETEMSRREWVAARLYPIATVGGLLLDEEDSVFLVRTRKWSGRWGIPGGKVDYGETLEQALRRELREETGLIAGEIRFILLHDSVESPEFYRPRHFLLSNYAVRVGGIRPEFRLNHESLEGRWMSEGEAMQLELNEPTRQLFAAYRRRGGWQGLQGVHF